MQVNRIRLPSMTLLLSLCLSFCARADVIYDSMTNAESSAYIVHHGKDDNSIQVEITGDYVIQRLVPSGSAEGSGISRENLRIRIPEIKLNTAENPHAETKDFFEIMELTYELSGQHDGFLNTQIQRSGESIRIDSTEYTDYSGTGSIETTFVNNREIRLDDVQQPVSFFIEDPPKISLFYKNERQLGERYFYDGIPDEFLLHDIYLGAYAVHSEHEERYEIMMERLLRLRYKDLYYQIRYHLHDPSQAEGNYQTLKENLSYLSIPDLTLSDASKTSRYRFVGWRLSELGEGAALTGPGSSESKGLPKTKSSESPMEVLSMFSTEKQSLYAAAANGLPAAQAAAILIDEERRNANDMQAAAAQSSIASGSVIASRSEIGKP